MKKLLPRLALILLTGGTLLLIVGLALGAQTNVSFSRGFRLTHSAQHEIDTTFSGFSSISAHVGISSITVEHGPEYRVTGHYGGHTLEVDLTDDTLQIASRSRGISLPFGPFEHQGGHIVITVPETSSLDRVALYTGVGSITLRNVSFTTLSLESGVGDVMVDVIGQASGFVYNISTGIGRASAGGAQSSGLGGSLQQRPNNPLGTIYASSGVGDVTVRFSE